MEAQQTPLAAKRRRRLAIDRAREVARKLAELGIDASVIGSLASERFSAQSDIDFLVVRYPRNLKYAIEGLVEDTLGGFRFDVIYLDDIPAAKRDRFLKEAIHASELR